MFGSFTAKGLGRVALLLVMATIGICLMAFDCGESAQIEFGYSYRPAKSLPQWSPDGAQIVVELGYAIYVVDVDGSNLKALHDTGNRNRDAHSPSISPDGTEVVYSRRLKTKGWLNYDLVVSNIDGSDDRRLTEDESHDIAPAWSPDGSRIAFLSGRLAGEDLSDGQYTGGFTLFTMAPDGSSVKSLARDIIVSQSPPIWSPDGRSLAFVANETPQSGNVYTTVLYTVGSDGSNLRKWSETLSRPVWSPDSMSIAFLNVNDDGSAVLYNTALDGPGPQEVVEVPLERTGDRGKVHFPILFWTLDGSEIKFGSYPFIVAATDGSDVQVHRHLYPEMADATWSPDGSKVAVNPQFAWDDSASEQDSEVALFSMSPDGTDKRVLIRYEKPGKYKEGKGELWDPDYARGQ